MVGIGLMLSGLVRVGLIRIGLVDFDWVIS